MSPVFANDDLALVGRLRGVRRRRRQEPAAARGREAAAHPRRIPARRRERASRSPASTRAGGSGSAACTRCSRASTTCSATSCAPTIHGWSDERVYQTARLIVSALIAKIHTVEWTPAILGDRGHRRRPQGQLERPTGQRLADQAGHLADRHPRQRGHPEDDAGPPRRAVLADRGLRHRLPAASAAARRLPLRRPPDRCSCSAVAGSSTSRAPRPTTRLRAFGLENTLYSFGIVPSRRDHAAQLPAVAAEVRARRRAHRPVGGRPGAHPPARSAPLQRLPGRAAQAAGQELGGALRQPGVGAPAARGLPQHRRGRHHGRPVRGDTAGRASGSPTPRSGSSS